MAHSNRVKRAAARKSQKLARKTAWATLIGTSRNKKLKTRAGSVKKHSPMAKVKEAIPAMIRGKLGSKTTMVHRGPKCFNVGCKRCSLVARQV